MSADSTQYLDVYVQKDDQWVRYTEVPDQKIYPDEPTRVRLTTDEIGTRGQIFKVTHPKNVTTSRWTRDDITNTIHELVTKTDPGFTAIVRQYYFEQNSKIPGRDLPPVTICITRVFDSHNVPRSDATTYRYLQPVDGRLFLVEIPLNDVSREWLLETNWKRVRSGVHKNNGGQKNLIMMNILHKLEYLHERTRASKVQNPAPQVLPVPVLVPVAVPVLQEPQVQEIHQELVPVNNDNSLAGQEQELPPAWKFFLLFLLSLLFPYYYQSLQNVPA